MMGRVAKYALLDAGFWIYQTGELSPSWSKALEEASTEALEALTPKLHAAGK
jgi:hypothetical protein